jgi:hypothetical protein
MQAVANTNKKFLDAAETINEALWHAGLSMRHNNTGQRAKDVMESMANHPSMGNVIKFPDISS